MTRSETIVDDNKRKHRATGACRRTAPSGKDVILDTRFPGIGYRLGSFSDNTKRQKTKNIKGNTE